MNIDFKRVFSNVNKRLLVYFFGAIGILLVLISSCSSTVPKEPMTEKKDSDYCTLLEARLEEILPKIAKVGCVDVMITAKNFGEIVLAESGTEDDTKTIILNQKGGGEDTKTIKELYPEIQGVIIIAQGGKSDKVKSDLTEAVTALLNIQAHKIKVFERKSDLNDF